MHEWACVQEHVVAHVIKALCFSEGWTGWSNLSANPCAANRHDGLNWTHLGCTDGVVTVLNFTGVPLNGESVCNGNCMHGSICR